MSSNVAAFRPCPLCGAAVTLGGYRAVENGAVLMVVVDPPGTFWPHLRDLHPAEYAEAVSRQARLNRVLGAQLGAAPRNVDGTLLRPGRVVGDLGDAPDLGVTGLALRNVDYRHLQEVPVRRQMSISDHDRSRQAMGHDSAAYLLGFAVEDGIITDEQRLALLERWLPWGDRQLTAGCEQSREDAQRIRREQGQGPS